MPQPSRRHLAAVLPAAGCGCACRGDAIAKWSWCTGEGLRREGGYTPRPGIHRGLPLVCTLQLARTRTLHVLALMAINKDDQKTGLASL
eukprot:729197-Prymnesium_polylepis.1